MWSKGKITSPTTGITYEYWVKHYAEPSKYGINGGKISKLSIREVNNTRYLCNYDRGWDIEPTNEVKAAYEIILAKYN